MRIVTWAGFAGLAALLAGCDAPNCQNSCFTLYDPESQCSSDVRGFTPEEAIEQCVDECDEALRQPGGMEGYIPTSNQGAPLVTETQAAAWMECIDNEPCEDLARGGGCFPRLR